MYQRQINVGGEMIAYNLSFKRVKNYNMRIRENGDLFVSAPIGTRAELIDKFVKDRIDFIREGRKKLEKRRMASPRLDNIEDGGVHTVFGEEMTLKIIQAKKQSVVLEDGKILLYIKCDASEEQKRRLLCRGLSEMLYKEVSDICREFFKLFSGLGIEYPIIKLRDMKTRWGTCNKTKNTITFSTMLIGTSSYFTEYVAMHELCHLIHADHSRKFYAELEKRMPDWKARAKSAYKI